MLTVLDLAEMDTSWNRKASTRKEKKGPCPDTTCSRRTDGFSVKWNGESWVFMCRGCWDSEEFLSEKDRKRGWGSELQYLMHYRKMKYSAALAALVNYGNLTLDEAVKRLSVMEPEQARAYLIKLGATDDGTINTEPSHNRVQRGPGRHVRITDAGQQEVIKTTLEDCIKLLRSDAGKDTLDYLYRRGIPDDLIEETYLGFSLKGGTPRLIIPSINGGRVVAIYRRDLRPDVAHSERWRDAPGSLDSELYLADSLARRDKPVVLVEAALDALSVIVDCGKDFVNVVATGGIKKCRNPDVLCRLARMPLVLVAFDADKDGDEASKWWLKRLANARRLRPILHDVNDMLVDNWDIHGWIEQAIAKASEQIIISAEQLQEEELTVMFEKPLCATCVDAGQETPALDEPAEDGCMYCAEHHPDRAPLVDGGIPVYHISDDEFMKRAQQEMLAKLAQDNEEQERQVRETRQAKRERGYAKLRGQLVVK